jgi:AcrR family transcriptional regulator
MTGQLNVEQVSAAGVRLVSTAGWSSLSIRSVAAALGVTPMALYRYVPDSAALSSAVLEAIVDRSARVVATGDPALDLMAWARQFHLDLSGYPGVAGWLLTHWFESPAMLDRIDELLEVVHTHGRQGFEAVAITNAIFTYVLMRCEAERQVRSSGVVKRQLRTATASRPLLRLTSLSKHYTTAEFDAHFEFGLHALIRGMQLADQLPC